MDTILANWTPPAEALTEIAAINSDSRAARAAQEVFNPHHLARERISRLISEIVTATPSLVGVAVRWRIFINSVSKNETQSRGLVHAFAIRAAAVSRQIYGSRITALRAARDARNQAQAAMQALIEADYGSRARVTVSTADLDSEIRARETQIEQLHVGGMIDTVDLSHLWGLHPSIDTLLAAFAVTDEELKEQIPQILGAPEAA